MNGDAIFVDQCWPGGAFCGAPSGVFATIGGEEMTTSEMTAVAAAVSGIALVCYLLMTPRRWGRGSSRDGSSAEGGDAGGDTGWSISSLFGGGGHFSLDSSGNPTDSGGDSGGGGDGGGGDGGGGD